MGYEGPEGAVEAVKSYVETNLAAKLTALNTEYADGITLEDRKITYKGRKSLSTIDRYPAMYVFSPSGRFTMEMSEFGTSLPDINLGMVVLDQNRERLQTRLYRYERAFKELIAKAEVDGITDGWLLAAEGDWEFDNVTARHTEDEDSDFVGELTMSFKVQKGETL